MTKPDLEKYRPMIASFELARDQEDELLISLWMVMQMFVDQGFMHDDPIEERKSYQLDSGADSANQIESSSNSQKQKHNERELSP